MPGSTFSLPGPGAWRWGGAFLGLADDATAAYTNPAGLSNLSVGGPEVAVEFRGLRYSNSFPERGNAFGSATGLGIDLVDGLEPGVTTSDAGGLSFLSVGYVLPRGWTVALYRHELADYRNENVSQGIFFLDKSDVPFLERGDCDLFAPPEREGFFTDCRTLPARTDLALQVVSYGFSAAWQLPGPLSKRLADSLSLGIGMAWSQFEIDQQRDYFAYLPASGFPGVDRLPGNLFGPVDLSLDRLLVQQRIEDNDDALLLNAGFLWKLGKGQRWSLGGAYRQGERFQVEGQLKPGPALGGEEIPPGLASNRLQFTIPDSFGLGVAYSASQGRTKLAFDWNRVLYSQRLADSVPRGSELRSSVRQLDSDELHLGVEHVFLVVPSLFVATVRGGAWHETAHDLEIVSRDPGDRAFAVPGKDQLHWSFGLGLVVKEDFQIDVGADFSDPVKTVSLSLVKFF